MSQVAQVIRLRILGSVALRDAQGTELRGLIAQHKRFALLCYLASSSRRRYRSRDELFNMFWPESDTTRARAALSQALYVLRTELGNEAVTVRGKEELGIDSSVVWCDAAEFDRAWDKGDYLAAFNLFRGDLLEGLHLVDTLEWEDWLQGQRMHFRGRAASAAWKCAEAAEEEGATAQAIRWGHRALRLAEDDEFHFRRLLELLDRCGDRAGAMKAYEAYRQRLAREYEVEVSPETSALIEQVRSRGDSGNAGPMESPAHARPSGGSESQTADVGQEKTSEPPGPGSAWTRTRLGVALSAIAGLLLGAWLWFEGGFTEADPADAEPNDPRSVEVQAQHFYLRGRHLVDRGDPASLNEARKHFERALELDPTHAQAWSGLSDAYVRLAWVHSLSPEIAYPRAHEAAKRALEHDPDLAEAHASLAETMARYFWDYDEAEQSFRKALAIEPDDADTRRRYATVLMVTGRYSEARAQAEQALELDPLAFATHFEVAMVNLAQNRYDDVLAKAEELIAINPQVPMGQFLRARALAGRGDYEAALAALDRMDMGPTARPGQTLRGWILGRMGREREARDLIRRLESLPPDAGGLPVAFDIAVIYAGLDEPQAALEMLERAADQHDHRVRLLWSEPVFANLREEPGFRALLERIGLGEVGLHQTASQRRMTRTSIGIGASRVCNIHGNKEWRIRARRS